MKIVDLIESQIKKTLIIRFLPSKLHFRKYFTHKNTMEDIMNLHKNREIYRNHEINS